MTEKYILACLMDLVVGLWFYGLCGLMSVAAISKNPWWKLPAMLAIYGSFAANVLVAWDVVDWLGFKKGTDGQSYAYFAWMAPMCLGIFGAMYYFKIRKDMRKKKAEQGFG